jgi:steroid delta-isomerase-like uncharacterized protein
MSAAMPTEDNKAIVRRCMDEVWNTGNLAVIDGLIAEDCTFNRPDNRPEVTRVRGPEALRTFVTLYRNAFPDLRIVIDDLLAEGDRVVCRWTVTGTQTGDLPSIPATGKVATVTGIDIDRIVDGKITEVWSEWDGASLRSQLGVSSE